MLGTTQFGPHHLFPNGQKPVTNSPGNMGLTLEQALETCSPSDSWAEYTALRDYDHPIVGRIDRLESERAGRARFRAVKKKLEDSLVARLRSGELVATAFKAPIGSDSSRTQIEPQLWEVLQPDFAGNSAEAEGIKLINLRITAGDTRSGIEPFEHTDDYSTVIVYGRTFEINGPTRRKAIKVLHKAWKSGNPRVKGKTLLSRCGSNALRVLDLFRGMTDWRELIGYDHTGEYWLRIDEPSDRAEKPQNLS